MATVTSVNLHEAAEKLRDLLHNGEGKEAETLLESLVRDDQFQAWFVTGTFKDVIRGYGKLGHIETGVTKDSNHVHPNPVPYVLFIGNEFGGLRMNGIVVDVWSAFSPDIARGFGYALFHRFEEEGLQPDHNEKVLEGMLLAARHLASRPFDRDLSRNVERVIIFSALFMNMVPLAKHFGLSEKAFKKPSEERRRLLNKYVERLYELGVDRIDVRDHFLECLKHNADKRSMESVLRLAGAKCFDRQSGRDPKLARILHDRYLHRFWEELTENVYENRTNLYPFAWLAQYGMVNQRLDKNLFRTKLTDLVSRGRIRQAWEIIDAIGGIGALGLYDISGHADIGGGSGMSEQDCHDDYATRYLESLVPDAFSQARSREEWGNAAARVNRFGANACLPRDQQRDKFDLSQLARNGQISEMAKHQAAIEEVQGICQKAVDANQIIPIETSTYYVRT